MNVTTTKIAAGVAALSVFAGVGLVSAHGPGHEGKSNQSTRAVAIEAIANNDYEAWAEAVGDHPKAQVITEANFGTLVEIHDLKEAGEHEEAKALAQELGLPMHKKFMRHDRHGGGHRALKVLHRIMHNDAAHAALEAEDYDAFVAAFGEDSDIAEKITEERFEKLVQMHNRLHNEE